MSSCRIRDIPTTGGIGDGGGGCIEQVPGGIKTAEGCSEGFGGLRISEGDNGLL